MEFVLQLCEYFEKKSRNGGPLIPVTQVRDRVAAALGICAPTVAKVTKEGFGSSGMEQDKLSTPKKRRQPCKTSQKIEDWSDVAFTNETWLNANHTLSKTWTDNTAGSTSALPMGKGERLIICHAGTVKGFVPDALLAFKSQKTGDEFGRV
ncbi:hypothetical protein EVAR_52370_1 [Eumeta japonica]|uniref:Uncharacterized protein n=1 Tax=Eumeta variegata TaxID=151549 RepID=A0A4C1YVI8_EUMVA|nr:hypothetical protein EVAR_52370_1 [Eumeta japonica]